MSARDEGASSIEYAILATLIAVVVILAVAALGREVRDDFDCTYDVIEEPLYECPN